MHPWHSQANPWATRASRRDERQARADLYGAAAAAALQHSQLRSAQPQLQPGHPGVQPAPAHPGFLPAGGIQGPVYFGASVPPGYKIRIGNLAQGTWESAFWHALWDSLDSWSQSNE